MALTVNWLTKVVYSTSSIVDLPAHHLELRDLEASETGMLYAPICNWQSLNLGGGATLPQIDYINSYKLEFIGSGPFTISGNLNATINATGVQVERKTSAAYATTSVGGAGGSGSILNVEEITAAVIAALKATPIPVTGNWPTVSQNASAVLASLKDNPPSVNVTFVKGHPIIGEGTLSDPLRMT